MTQKRITLTIPTADYQSLVERVGRLTVNDGYEIARILSEAESRARADAKRRRGRRFPKWRNRNR